MEGVKEPSVQCDAMMEKSETESKDILATKGLSVVDDDTKICVETEVKEVSSREIFSKGFNSKLREASGQCEATMEDTDAEDKKNLNTKISLTETVITNAMLKLASYIRQNSETISMSQLRRLLEEDLKLEKNGLIPFKKFISEKVVEILNTEEIPVPSKKLKKNSTKSLNGKVPSESHHEENSDPLDNESLDVEEDNEVKPRKKNASKGQMLIKGGKKRGRPAKEPNVPKKIQKSVETSSEIVLYKEGSGDIDDGSHSEASDDKSLKGKEVSNPSYEKRVGLLKSIIKSCGMSVPPYIYKQVKQVPQDEREVCLIKELEKILSREGLSANPSQSEIKKVKKKKEKEKELEGIDMSNIVVTSRRRSCVGPVLQKPRVESDGDDGDGNDVGDSGKDDGDGNDEDDDGGGDDSEEESGDNNDDGSQSEEDFNKDEEESD